MSLLEAVAVAVAGDWDKAGDLLQAAVGTTPGDGFRTCFDMAATAAQITRMGFDDPVGPMRASTVRREGGTLTDDDAIAVAAFTCAVGNGDANGAYTLFRQVLNDADAEVLLPTFIAALFRQTVDAMRGELADGSDL